MKESVMLLIGLSKSIQALHWQTKSYSEHKALGKFYESLEGLLDTFVETYQGRYERLNISGQINIKSQDSYSLCMNVVARVVEMEKQLDKTDTDLLNILADMKQAANHTMYLITLT